MTLARTPFSAQSASPTVCLRRKFAVWALVEQAGAIAVTAADVLKQTERRDQLLTGAGIGAPVVGLVPGDPRRHENTERTIAAGIGGTP